MWQIGTFVGLQASWLATETPASAAAHAFEYVVSSHPQTGTESSVQISGRTVHTP
jgi:hypothetical protein